MADKPRIKGPARAEKSGALRERSHVALDRHTEELLFAEVEVLSEGSVRDRVFYGSTMITIDLGRVEASLRRPLGIEGRARLLAAMDGSVRVRIRAMRIALDEVARRFPTEKLGTAHVETRVDLTGDELHLDVDLEVPFGVSSAESR
jgi:hypothetical protein